MSELEHRLKEVYRLNASVQPGEAEAMVRQILASEPHELAMAEREVRGAIGSFLPKRRRLLDALLDNQLAVNRGKVKAAEARLSFRALPERIVDTQHQDAIISKFDAELIYLSNHQIFQWGTFYRDVLSEYFDVILEIVQDLSRPARFLSKVQKSLSLHSTEIFNKGYVFQQSVADSTADTRRYKSLGGLQKFTDLLIELYSTKLVGARDSAYGKSLRATASAMICGVLEGFCNTTLDEDGSALLPVHPRSWLHVVPFLTPRDFATLLTALQPGELVESLIDSVKPLLDSIEALESESNYLLPLPAISQLVWYERRLDVSLDATAEVGQPRFIEVSCCLEPELVSRPTVEEALARHVDVLIAPMNADLHVFVMSQQRLSDVVVQVAGLAEAGNAAARVTSRLKEVLSANELDASVERPVTFNFARNFPLENPSAARYFHVYRSSVRQLLQTFERRNGVRLWCSVRRSGKTTACAVDLDSTTGRSLVVSQTCDDTGQMSTPSTLYPAICRALDEGLQLPGGFVRDEIATAAGGQNASSDRVVFVLDEYETLFGRLKSALRRDPDIRYTVVQPLLNQLVAFTQDNLLVFLGQQPNAHYILMDQNQLSPYVEQDAFPLFSHDSTGLRGELVELINKVFKDRVDFNVQFANAVFAETAGHPYLTVNLLVDFIDWVIAKRIPIFAIEVGEGEFRDFANERLALAWIARSGTYDFFKAAAAEALGSDGKIQNPWLHVVYKSLRELSLDYAKSPCQIDDFERICTRNADGLDLDASSLLASARRANFLEVTDNLVQPKVRLLARIAAAVNRTSR